MIPFLKLCETFQAEEVHYQRVRGLVGTLGLYCSASTYDRVYSRDFEEDKFLALEASSGKFEA